MSEYQFNDQVRSRLSAVAQRAKDDASYMTQLGADPIGTLTAAGVPEPDVLRLLSVTADAEEVTGYARCTVPTCRWTICPGTCFPMTIYA
jgi:hypothetical protein